MDGRYGCVRASDDDRAHGLPHMRGALVPCRPVTRYNPRTSTLRKAYRTYTPDRYVHSASASLPSAGPMPGAAASVSIIRPPDGIGKGNFAETNVEHACRIRAPPEPFVRVKCAESARKGGSDAHIRLTDRELRC